MTDWIVRHWPLLATIGACFIFDGLSVFALHLFSNTSIHWAVLGAVVGMWWGQVLLAIAIAGLSGRTWIEGFSIGLTLTLLGLAAFAGSMLASGEVRSFDTHTLSAVAALPGLMFAACLPLYFLRQWRGWRFISNSREKNPLPHATSRAVGIEDLLLVTTMVAAALILTRIPAVWWEIKSWIYWSNLVGVSLILGAVTSPLIVPTYWVVFRIHRGRRLAVALILLWLIAINLTIAAVYVSAFLYGMRPNFRLDIIFAIALAGSLMATLLGGLLVFRISGYTLGERRKKSKEPIANARPTIPSRLSSVNTDRALAAGFFIVAAVANIPAASLELEHRQRDQDLDELAQQVSERGGSAIVTNHQLTTLIAWPDLTDAELREFDLSAVRTLSLADSQVSDAILPELKKGRVVYLDLSRTQFSEQALAQCGLTYLYRLKLSAPQFTGKCFESWPLTLTELDLSNSGVTDDTLVYVKKFSPLQSLDLSHTAVNDDGLAHLSKTQIEQLNISDTHVTAEGVRVLKLAKAIVISPGQFNPAERQSLEAIGVQVIEQQ